MRAHPRPHARGEGQAGIVHGKGDVARGIDAARAEAETAPPATKRGSFFDTVDEHDDEHDVDDGDDDGAPPRTGAPEESQ